MPHFQRPRSVCTRLPWWSFLLCSLLVAGYFLAFPNHRYGYDAMEYSYGVKRGHSLFHPHHLLYNAAGRVLLLAVSPFANVDTLGLLSAANAVITATSMGLLCLLIHRLVRSLSLAIRLGLLFAACRGITYMATSVEVYPATTLFELCALCLFVFRPRLSIPSVIGIAMASALAALFHQTGIFFVLAMAYGIWVRDRLLRHVLGFLTIALGFCAGAYLWVGVIVEKRPVFGLWKWITMYAHSEEFQLGMWGHGLRWQSIPSALQGLFQTIAAPYYLDNIDLQFRPRLADVVFSLALISALGFLLRLSVQALRRRQQKLTLSMQAGQGITSALSDTHLRGLIRCWILLHAAFTFWWEPGNFEFWLLLVPPLLLLLGDLWQHLELRSPVTQLQLTAVPLLLLIGNLELCTIPNYRGVDNPCAEIYRTIASSGVDPEDAYIGDFATLQLYFLYYQDKHVPLHSLRFLGYSDPAQKSSLLADYRSRLTELRRRHRVFFLEHELSDVYDFWSAADVHTLYEPLLSPATVIGSYRRGTRTFRIFRLAPIPAAIPNR